MVLVIDQITFEEFHQTDFSADQQLGDYALSEREPEQAYYKFAPGETVYMAGGIYKISSDSPGRYALPTDTLPVYSYSYFLSNEVVGFASKSKAYTHYDRTQNFVGTVDLNNDNYKVVRLYYYPDCTLSFRNNGIKEFGQVIPFKLGNESFVVGYNLKRQAIILEFDRRVCADGRYY
jgi:hypothetical protein